MNEALLASVICENVRLLREYADYSLTKMAAVMQVDPRTIKRLEAGELPPRLNAQKYINLAEHFEISPIDVMFDAALLQSGKLPRLWLGKPAKAKRRG